MKMIDELKVRLTPRQLEMLNLLINYDNRDYSNTANYLGLTKERVRQLKKEVITIIYRAIYKKYPFIVSKYCNDFGIQEDYFPFYYSCDSLEDSHDEYIRKLK